MIVIGILVLSIITHLFRFGFPNSVVFDEVFFGKFTSLYVHNSYFFDQHPPFAKLLFALLGYIFGVGNYDINWDAIGNFMPPEAIAVRILPVLAGIVLPLVIYSLCRSLRFSRIASSVAGILVALEGSLIVQSRYILMDSIMLLTGFLSFLFYFKYLERDRYSRWYMAGSIACAMMALSVKWTGLTFLFMIVILEAYRLFALNVKVQDWFKRVIKFSLIFIIPAAVFYYSLFLIHFAILYKTGPGDVFMSQAFQKTLVGTAASVDPNIESEGTLAKFLELNRVMYTSNRDMKAEHSYSSKWYTWPIMWRPIFYWELNNASGHSYIYLFGNPVIYYLGTASVISMVLYALYEYARKKKRQAMSYEHKRMLLFVLLGYAANWLPFIFIGRVMFIYHYFTALVISIIALAYVLESFPKKWKIALSILVLALALAAYIYWAPILYGLPLSDDAMASRMWLSSWR